jgi:hypothetical protein
VKGRLYRWLAVLTLVLLGSGGCVPLPVTPVGVPPAASGGPPAPRGAPAAQETPWAGRLEARRIPAAPRLDGPLDAVWATAPPVQIPLAKGLDGDPRVPAVTVELAAVYTTDALYFRARWPGAPPLAAANTTFNQLTIHWAIPVQTDLPAPACAVACHTAYVDGHGRVAYMNSETIPQGGEDALAAAGGWAQGEWTVMWSRPLVSANAYDLQFADLGGAYTFFIKVFARTEGQPDPVSKPHVLVFAP